ncbi:glycerophosphodiester phosphodiesterase [soil metagenome]
MSLSDSLWRPRQIIAHRGSRLAWPENTMLAFGNGIQAGADHLETDVHLTADGHIVCFHDDTLDRTTDGTGAVSSLTLSEIRRYDAGYRHSVHGGFPFRGRGLRVPTLGEVLATFPGVGVIVDLKQEGLEQPLIDLVDRLDAWKRVIVGSFVEARLNTLRRLSDGVAQVSAGPETARRWWWASRLGRPGPVGPVALQVPPTRLGMVVVDRRLVRAAHDAGLAVHVWTINQRSEMDRLWSLGVDALITDRVDLAREVTSA